jgi:SAM-dependent methyltransferase
MSLSIAIQNIQNEIAVRGYPTDKTFNALFSDEMRKLASEFWSPTAVSFQVAKHLCSPSNSVLDVGSGSGKFCLLAAMLFPETHFVGVEHRPSLVAIGRSLQKQLGLKNLEFRCEDAFKSTWSNFGGLYFYNPFEEQTYAQDELKYTDGSLIALNLENYRRFGTNTQARLNRLSAGARVAVYNGFHKVYSLPASFEVIKEPVVKGCQLIFAQKKPSTMD